MYIYHDPGVLAKQLANTRYNENNDQADISLILSHTRLLAFAFPHQHCIARRRVVARISNCTFHGISRLDIGIQTMPINFNAHV